MNAYDPESSPLNSPKAERAKILVVRFKAIGDVIVTSALCNTLKKTFPNAQVDYLVHDVSAPLFSDHPHIDNVIGLSLAERKNPFLYFKKIRSITAQGYDLVVDAQSTNKSEFVSMFARKRAICIGRVKRGRGLFYTNKVDAKVGGGNKLDERFRLLDPLEAMGFAVKRDDNFTIKVSMELKDKLRENMLAADIDFDRPIFLLSVTAKEAHKRWNMHKMQAWAQYAMDRYKSQLVLFWGSEEERLLAREFFENMGEHPDVNLRVNTDSLPKLAALMSHCDLFMGNEGGPRHMAQACGLPTASIFSPCAHKSEWLVSNSSLHQGVSWRDVYECSEEERDNLEQGFDLDGEKYRELYSSIDTSHAIELLDAVADAAGVSMVSTIE